MKTITIDSIKTEEAARQYAVYWQGWASEQSLSYNELSDWQIFFTVLAQKFNLTEEFKENAII